MKNYKKYLAFTIICLIAFGCGQEKKDKFHYKTITEVDSLHVTTTYANDFVNVLKIELHEKEQIPAHSSKARLIYSMSDYSTMLIMGADSLAKEWQTGDVHWHDDAPHAIDNIGTTTAKFLAISRTDMELPGIDTTKQIDDLSKINSEAAQILFGNDILEVVRVNLSAGDEIISHYGINRLFYSESDLHLELTGESDLVVELTLQKGEIRWFLPSSQALKNMSENSAQFLIISFK